jgi:iron complex outermembrane receptor protein
VAGVVNFVLKKKINGVQGTVQQGVSKYGDNRETLVSLGGGRSFLDEKLHIIAGGEYSKASGVDTLPARPWGARLPGLVAFGATRAAGTPSQGFATGVLYSAQTAGGLITAGPLRGTAFGPGGTPYAFGYGQVFSSLMIGGDATASNPFGNWPIITPTKRKTAMLRATYELSPDIELSAEFMKGRTEATGFTSFNQSSFVISRDNPFLPAAIVNQMVANNLQTITVGKLLTELGGLRQYNRHDGNQINLMIDGQLPNGWSWSGRYSYGRSKNFESILNNTLSANYNAAVAAVRDASGAIVCAPIATNPNLTATTRLNVQPGCVPINIFGVGSPSQASKDYITETSYGTSDLKRQGAAIDLRGSPIATWAGPVQLALGAEVREDSLVAGADALGAQALFPSGARNPYSGKVSIKEGYAEVGLPLARDLAWAKNIDLNAAVRRTDYSTSGQVTTWKVGATYDIVDTLRLRATRSRDIRAPNLSELYASGNPGVSTASAVNPINGRTGALITQVSGNLDLTPEIADTKSIGLVFQPNWAWTGPVKISADYFDISVKDVIASVVALDILRRCGAGLQQYCDAVTFDNSNFGVANVRLKPFNLSELSTNGLDVELSMRPPIDRIGLPGRLDVRALGTKVWDRITTDSAGSIDRAGSVQGGGVPTWTWNFDANYTLDRLSATLSARYSSAVLFDTTLVGPDSAQYSPALSNSINDNTFPSALYFNGAVQYDVIDQVGRKIQLYGSVNNILNASPPQFAAIGINSGGDPYDLIGRRYRVGVRFKF